MTVHTLPEVDEKLRAAQLAWNQAEFDARAAFALVRLDALDRLETPLTVSDRFDAAYSIWDDYIDGRRADERYGPLRTAEAREQASIFARVALRLGPADVLDLAKRAWGTETFEVFTRTPEGIKTGKLGWYRGDTLHVVHAFRGISYTYSFDRNTARVSTRALELDRRVALHPAFGRADS